MGVGAAIGGSALVGAYMTDKAGKRAEGAANNAAATAAQSERDKLEYMKEVEALPLEIRDKFLPQLADITSGGQGQQDLINSAMQSPLYKQMIGNIDGGNALAEDAMLRSRSATGDLRSGGSLEDMARLQFENQNARNAALTQTYGGQLQGIQGLAGIPLNTNQIGNAIAAPGQSLAAGQIAGANARQQGTQGAYNAISSGIGNMAMLYGGSGGGQPYDAMNYNGAGGGIPTDQWLASDIRLKDNITLNCSKNGFNWYQWDWNSKAEEIGLIGKSNGYMAHEVFEKRPDAVATVNGHLVVNYSYLEKDDGQ